jgi:hypothetical protein
MNLGLTYLAITGLALGLHATYLEPGAGADSGVLDEAQKRDLTVLAGNVSAQSQSSTMVAAAYKDPGGKWEDYPTRTLADLPPAIREKTDSNLDPYGGHLTAKSQKTGFFHTTKLDDRWWLVDPDGFLCIYIGIASVSTLRVWGPFYVTITQYGRFHARSSHPARGAVLRTGVPAQPQTLGQS